MLTGTFPASPGSFTQRHIEGDEIRAGPTRHGNQAATPAKQGEAFAHVATNGCHLGSETVETSQVNLVNFMLILEFCWNGVTHINTSTSKSIIGIKNRQLVWNAGPIYIVPLVKSKKNGLLPTQNAWIIPVVLPGTWSLRWGFQGPKATGWLDIIRISR